MSQVLVLGGAGYIGSHVCKLLFQNGYSPVVFDNLSTGNRWAVKWGNFEFGDIRDTARVEEVIQKYKPLAIMHFAGLAYVGESVRNPLAYFEVNVAGSISVLMAMKKTGLRKIIFSSTCATYGSPDLISISEGCTQNPVNPYGRSKLMVEKILIDTQSSGEIDFIGLRYFNAAGADFDCEIGELHNPETHLIPLIQHAILDGKKFAVFGGDYETEDGTCVRDFIHVNDLASAHIAALKFLELQGTSQFFNVGTGRGHSVMEVIKSVERVAGKRLEYSVGPRRTGDPAYLVAAPALAMGVLNWEPRIIEIDDIVKSSMNWEIALRKGLSGAN